MRKQKTFGIKHGVPGIFLACLVLAQGMVPGWVLVFELAQPAQGRQGAFQSEQALACGRVF